MPARAFRQIGLRAILARKKALGQRKITDDANVVFQTGRLQISFIIGAVIKVVERLQTLVAGITMLLTDRERLAQALAFVV